MKSLIVSSVLPKEVKALLYLDIDGVLNQHRPFNSGWCGMDTEPVHLVNSLLGRYPTLGVVLISSWRYLIFSGYYQLEGLEKLLATHGLDIMGRLVGWTDADESVEGWESMPRNEIREELIKRHLRKNPHMPYVVLDDTIGVSTVFQVTINGYSGLTANDIRLADSFLQQQGVK